MTAHRWRHRTQPQADRNQRGYGSHYQHIRYQINKQVQAGDTTCWRCGGWIPPGTTWHLGHDDHNRDIIRGPEHPRCNLRAAAKAGAAKRHHHPTPAYTRNNW